MIEFWAHRLSSLFWVDSSVEHGLQQMTILFEKYHKSGEINILLDSILSILFQILVAH